MLAEYVIYAATAVASAENFEGAGCHSHFLGILNWDGHGGDCRVTRAVTPQSRWSRRIRHIRPRIHSRAYLRTAKRTPTELCDDSFAYETVGSLRWP